MIEHQNATERGTGQDSDIFQAFPAPRVWHFGGDEWAGNAQVGAAHEKDTTDFLPSAPPVPPSHRIEISIIPKTSIR